MEVADLNVRLRADSSGMSAGFRQAESSAAAFQSSIQSMGMSLVGIGAAMSASITAPIVAVGALGISFNAMKEQATVAFTQLLGSGEKASAFLKELAQFAAVTPFEFPGLVTSAQKFTAIGVEAKNVIPILTSLGDAVAAFGGKSEDIDRVTVQLVQMIAKGKVSMQDLRVVADSVPAAVGAMAKELGISVSEMFAKMEKGSLSAAEGVSAMLIGLTKQFHGSMEKQSQTFSGLMSTLKDTARFAAADITESLFGLLKNGLVKLVEYLPKVVAAFQGIPDQVKLMTVAIAGVVAAIGPVMLALGGVVALLGGPLTIAIVAVTALLVTFTAAVALNFSRILEIVTGSVGGIKVNFVALAGYMGAALDGFQALARGAIAAFDIIVTGAVLLGQGVKAAFYAIRDAGSAAMALARNDMVGFAVALSGLATSSLDSATSIGKSLQGLIGRVGSDMKNISSHMSGEFAKSFAMAAASAGQAASTTQRSMSEIIASLKDAFSKTGDLTEKQAKKIGSAAKESAAAMKDFAEAVKQSAEHAAAGVYFVNKAVEDLTELMNDLPLPVLKFVDALELTNAAMSKQSKGIQDLIGFGHGWMLFINEAKRRLEDHNRIVEETGKLYHDLSQQLPRAWNTILNGIIQGSGKTGEALLNLGVKVKGYAVDIINVFDTMPGKWGQSLNRALDEVNRWINFIDASLKLVQRLIGESQTGLAGIFESVAGSLKRSTDTMGMSHEQIGLTAKQASQGLDELSGQLAKSGDEAGETASKWVSAIAGVVAGISMFASTRGQGLATGIFGGAMGGFTAGAAIGSIIPGLGTLIGGGIGALIGGIAGIFGSGKSETQKKAEQDAIAAAKLSAEQTGQQIVGTYIDNLSKALNFFAQVDEFRDISQERFNKFMNAFKDLLTRFVDLMKAFANENVAKAKELAEAISPIADAISRLPLAFEGISKHMKVPKGQFDLFFRDFSRMMGSFFELAESWIDGQSKQAMKVAERLAPVVNLFMPLIEAITAMGDIEAPTNRAFHIVFRSLQRFVERIADMQSLFDKSVLKSIENFAIKIAPVTDLWKSVTDGIKGMFELTMPSDATFEAMFGGIEKMIAGMTALSDRLNLAAIDKAVAISTAVVPIAGALKAWAEAAAAIHGYVAIAAEVWDQIVTDFERGLVLLNLLILDATLYVEKAKTFKSLIDEGAAFIKDAISTYANSIASAGSALAAQLPQGGSAVGGYTAASSLGLLSASSLGSSPQTSNSSVTVNVTVMGTVIEKERLADSIVRVIQEQSKRGRLAPI